MIIYEVNVEVDNEIYTPYKAWLIGHIQKILTFPGFKQAKILTELDEKAQALPINKLAIVYYISSMEDLKNYLSNHSSQLRKEALDNFPLGLIYTRRVLRVDEVLTAE